MMQAMSLDRVEDVHEPTGRVPTYVTVSADSKDVPDTQRTEDGAFWHIEQRNDAHGYQEQLCRVTYRALHGIHLRDMVVRSV